MNFLNGLLLALVLLLKAFMESPKEPDEDVIAEEENVEVRDTSYDDNGEEPFIDPESYIGKFSDKQLDSLLWKKMNHYISTSNEEVDDSSGNPISGYLGSVDIRKLTHKGFDFEMDVWNIGHGGGNISGHAKFVESNYALFDLEENNPFEKFGCQLSFIFHSDTLYVDEISCGSWHGAGAGFTDKYVLVK